MFRKIKFIIHFGNSLLNDKDKRLIEKILKKSIGKKLINSVLNGIGVNIKSGVLRFFMGKNNLKVNIIGTFLRGIQSNIVQSTYCPEGL